MHTGRFLELSPAAALGRAGGFAASPSAAMASAGFPKGSLVQSRRWTSLSQAEIDEELTDILSDVLAKFYPLLLKQTLHIVILVSMLLQQTTSYDACSNATWKAMFWYECTGSIIRAPIYKSVFTISCTAAILVH